MKVGAELFQRRAGWEPGAVGELERPVRVIGPFFAPSLVITLCGPNLSCSHSTEEAWLTFEVLGVHARVGFVGSSVHTAGLGKETD